MNLSTFTRRTVVVLLAVSLLLMGATSGVAAQSAQPAWASDYYEQFEGMVSTYNEEVVKHVDSGGTYTRILAGEIVNLRIEASDGTVGKFSFKFDETIRMTELREGHREDATVQMTISKAKFDEIIDDPSPAIAFMNALETGDIELKGLGGPLGKVKYIIVEWALLLKNMFFVL